MVNDRGSWLVACRECNQQFTIKLRNPVESYTDECVILQRFDDEIDAYEGDAPSPGASAVYDLDLNPDKPRFDAEAFAIYRCASSGDNLEEAAIKALRAEWDGIADQCAHAANQMLASRLPDVEHCVMHVEADCSCGERHPAVFYRPWRLDGARLPAPEDMLLADVGGSDLEDRLTGILSKTDLMQALEKLIARWRLFCDQVLLATPFVAHQWKTKEERLAIWERLLQQLDNTRTVLLTRGKTYKEYEAALLDAGLDHALLARFGLENKVVGDGHRKQDFHAKVYIGLGPTCEVLSGSANVVSGQSKENATFQVVSRSKVQKSYVEPLGLELPSPYPRLAHHVAISRRAGYWRWDIVKGAAPERSSEL